MYINLNIFSSSDFPSFDKMYVCMTIKYNASSCGYSLLPN